MLPPNPLCIFEMYRITKSRWRTRPSIWIPASILTHMTAQRHSAPQPSVCEVPKSPPSPNKQANEKRILHTKHTVHNKHVQWNRSHQVRTIRASLDYKCTYVLSELHIEHKRGSLSSQISSLAALESQREHKIGWRGEMLFHLYSCVCVLVEECGQYIWLHGTWKACLFLSQKSIVDREKENVRQSRDRGILPGALLNSCDHTVQMIKIKLQKLQMFNEEDLKTLFYEDRKTKLVWENKYSNNSLMV